MGIAGGVLLKPSHPLDRVFPDHKKRERPALEADRSRMSIERDSFVSIGILKRVQDSATTASHTDQTKTGKSGDGGRRNHDQEILIGGVGTTKE